MTDTALARNSGQQHAIESSQPRVLTWEMIENLTGYDQAQIALVARTVAKDAPMQELVVFLHACKTLQLDPLLRQAYWIRRRQGDEVRGALQVGIDGFRAIAERSGAYAGSEPPRFLGQMEITYKGRRVIVPERAQVVVWKIVQGHKAAFTGEANWEEFYPGERDGFMYAKMPRHMLAKDAEAQALRKAFPALLGAIQQSSVIGEDVPAGELPEVAAPARIVEQPRPKTAIGDYDRTIAAEYDAQDRGWTPAAGVESVRQDPDQAAPERREEATGLEGVAMVKNRSHASWKAWVDATVKATANEVPFDEIELPVAQHALDAATRTLYEMVTDKTGAEQENFT